jgi:multidrug efflux pump subunit AcrA (membrane-fusion protein)
VLERDGRSAVFVVRGDRAKETDIRTGQILGELVEVTGGLRAGERVVLKPGGRLRDGARIKIAEK